MPRDSFDEAPRSSRLHLMRLIDSGAGLRCLDTLRGCAGHTIRICGPVFFRISALSD
ncbi:hypothetical protein UFOVP726_31 [uncultured Caudovirales phage]|uniref:Uncharacterized protein n=1 Tax=uncultured Caudovirales phage TaxID=2100421 RepID=A0A6J5NLM0_9CAUD|nr:hypothetical protein UFOVP726_31 [uncultured Caudovirales phage]